jgi:ribose transport system ATP-binding protein
LQLIAGPERERERQAQPLPQRQSEKPLLRVEQARVWHDGAAINLSLYPGEIVGVTGLDGQGQGDFVRCLAGVQSLISGRVEYLQGKRVQEIHGLADARANNISYVSGDRKKEGILPNLSIFENMMMPVYGEYRLGGFLNLMNRTKLAPLFEWEASKLAVKMGDRDNPITSLSGGNQQKVLIARAFAEKPSVLVLNDPARGIDVGAKFDLYRNLKSFAATGNTVVFLSSEIEEFLNLCTRVLVFRNGSISSEFLPPYDGHGILNAMFGRKATEALPGTTSPHEEGVPIALNRAPARFEDGRPMPRSLRSEAERVTADSKGTFRLESPDIEPGSLIGERFAEENRTSPRLVWTGVPEGTRSFALAVTDPDLPEAFQFPRAFAHWLVHDIPASVRELPQGASQGPLMPAVARELNSDFVTFKIPGFGAGYGGPWPPDRQHRYVFTLYALKTERLELGRDAGFEAFSAAVLPVAIESTSFTALYGPAKKPLPH